jgi:hypothetical protein
VGATEQSGMTDVPGVVDVLWSEICVIGVSYPPALAIAAAVALIAQAA